MFGLGMPELIIILIIALLVFGVGKLPEIGTNLGKAIKGFKKGMSDTEIDVTPKQEDKAEKKQ